MFDHAAREAKEYVLAPVAAVLNRIHPTTVTFVSFLLGLISIGLAWQQVYLWSALFAALNRIADGLDGTMARLHAKQSDLGGYVDILADFAFYALLPIALVAGEPTPARYLALAYLLGSYYLNAASWMYLSAILEKRERGAKQQGEKTAVTMPAAVIGGLETTFIYPIFILWHAQMEVLFVIMATLVLVSIAQRLVWASRNL